MSEDDFSETKRCRSREKENGGESASLQRAARCEASLMHSTGKEASLLSPAPSSEQLEALDAERDFFFVVDDSRINLEDINQ